MPLNRNATIFHLPEAPNPTTPLSHPAIARVAFRALDSQAMYLPVSPDQVDTIRSTVGEYLNHAICASLPVHDLDTVQRLTRPPTNPDDTAPFGAAAASAAEVLPRAEYLQPLPSHLPEPDREVVRHALLYAALYDGDPGLRVEAADVLAHAQDVI